MAMGRLASFVKLFARSYRQYKKSGGILHLSIAQVNHGGILSGRKVIVTGGSDGIGLAMAQKFLSEGAAVLITGRSEDKLVSAKQRLASDNLLSLVWDVSDYAVLDSKLDESISLLGGLDLFVNNAAYIPTTAITEDCWDKTLDTNLKSVYFICKSVIDYYLTLHDDLCRKIINVSSLNSVQSRPHPYFISKSGLNAITRGFAKQYADRNIIVNGIAPGICASSINYQDVGENAFYGASPNKRIITPTEVAELACFLASDAANGIIGQTIFCDGGATL